MSNRNITAKDVRKYTNGCVPGMKSFCLRYNINFKDALKNGIPQEVLVKTNDPNALLVVEKVNHE